MIRSFFTVITIMLLGWWFTSFGPWWAVVFAGFLGGLILFRKPWLAFFLGFLAGLLLWYIQITFLGGTTTDLPMRMAELMGAGSARKLVWASAAIGGLVTGLGALSANVGKKHKRRAYGSE